MNSKIPARIRHVQCKGCCTVPAAPLKFEAFIRKAFSFLRRLVAFGALMFLLENRQSGPLLLYILGGGGGGGEGGDTRFFSDIVQFIYKKNSGPPMQKDIIESSY